MRGELVAIDLETTGLDSTRDEIIEIGAVRFVDGAVVDEFQTFVDPGRSLPTLITSLTGIRNEDLVGAPSIQAVLPKLLAFVGDAPWMAHNVGFDASFLYRQGVLQNNLRTDTYELASVLLPRAPRYNLTSLTSLFGFDIGSAHRALYDAKATAYLYWVLWQKALALPYATLREITEAAQGLRWDGLPVFQAALRERVPEDDERGEALFAPDRTERKPLRPNENTEPIDQEQIAVIIDEGGLLASRLPGYEYRSQQVDMAQTVGNAFNNAQHLMIEAGTGTGKSLAYLVPAVLWAQQNNERVVISTNTINLQEQLIDKDIPTLRDALDLRFSASVMKGRANYLCPRRLQAVRRRRPTSVDELRTLSKILVWLLESQTGDKGEISLRGTEENLTWQRLSAEDEGCTLGRCQAVMEGSCPFYKARKAAEAARVLVVNHALLISDAAMENRVLPEFRYLIIDEAHHLEEATTNGLSFRLDAGTLRRQLADLGGPRRGLLGSLLTSITANAPDKEIRRLTAYIENISDATGAMEVHVNRLFASLRSLLADLNVPRNEYLIQVRVVDAVRARPSFSDVQAAWNTLHPFFEVLGEAMHHLAVALTRLEPYEIPNYEELVSSTEAASRHLEEAQVQLNNFANTPNANTIYWISAGQDSEYLAVNSAPLHVGPLVEEYLWRAKSSVVMTSATLQTNRSFEYIRERLNAGDIEAVEVGSPFNYRDSTLLYIPTDMPDPNDRYKYQQAVERGLIELTAALNGRVLGLFTSYAHLRQTAQAITPRLALGNITVYDQSDGSSRQSLLDGFKTSERAILLGTRSFWEGVDIPGDSLSALVIVRLPFSVPTDPVFAARAETYTDSFNDYTLPDAILRFRQGFGRLIRSRSDRGIVAIFDSRVITKSYGTSFLAALPDCTVKRAPLASLPESATEWLG
ncbi:MAG: DEAD/DEAH box helicase family protein, partial [Anaerolineae bacterium]|nr:DEAD/DEAH box helicase family protein [Anaerolineae bacterium]